MELVAIEQASIVYSRARTALERSAHVDHRRRHHCRARLRRLLRRANRRRHPRQAAATVNFLLVLTE